MRISVVIPHWSFPTSDAALRICIASLVGQYDELLVVSNERIGFGPAVNLGLAAASGDFIVVANNDSKLVRGSLYALCRPGLLTGPLNKGRDVRTHVGMTGFFFCIPREVYEKVGGFDERFERGFFEDDDLVLRVRKAGFDTALVPEVDVEHDGGLTMAEIKKLNLWPFDENQRRFREKWRDAASRGEVQSVWLQ